MLRTALKSPWILALVAGSIALFWPRTINTMWKHAKNAEKYLPLLKSAEIKYALPTDLLARLAYQESRFRDDIVSGTASSSAGAKGLMQLVPKWHPTVDPLNVPAAIDYAARYLLQLYAQFKSWPLALAAYNAGPGNVQKYNGIPPFEETRNYVTQIMNDLPRNTVRVT